MTITYRHRCERCMAYVHPDECVAFEKPVHRRGRPYKHFGKSLGSRPHWYICLWCAEELHVLALAKREKAA